jgi:bifunctional polynucleotide phosphatase/kinase
VTIKGPHSAIRVLLSCRTAVPIFTWRISNRSGFSVFQRDWLHAHRLRIHSYSDHNDIMGEKTKQDGEAKGSPAVKRAKKAVLKGPTLLEDGFTVSPADFLIYKKHAEYKVSDKILALDMDNTLIYRNPDSKGKFMPEDEDDFVIFNPSVKRTLEEYHKKGYGLVIFSNQGMIKSAMTGKASGIIRGLVSNLLKALDGIPINVLLATADVRAGSEYRKPGTGMWEHFVKEMNDEVEPNKEESLYVGDAAGRPSDINNGSDSDKKFAEAIGISFKTPEEIFGPIGGGKKENDAMGRAFIELANVYLADFMDIPNKFFKAKFLRSTGEHILRHGDVITSSDQLKGIKGIGEGSRKLVDQFLEHGELKDIQAIRNGTWEDPKERKKNEAAKSSKTITVGQQFL